MSSSFRFPTTLWFPKRIVRTSPKRTFPLLFWSPCISVKVYIVTPICVIEIGIGIKHTKRLTWISLFSVTWFLAEGRSVREYIVTCSAKTWWTSICFRYTTSSTFLVGTKFILSREYMVLRIIAFTLKGIREREQTSSIRAIKLLLTAIPFELRGLISMFFESPRRFSPTSPIDKHTRKSCIRSWHSWFCTWTSGKWLYRTCTTNDSIFSLRFTLLCSRSAYIVFEITGSRLLKRFTTWCEGIVSCMFQLCEVDRFLLLRFHIQTSINTRETISLIRTTG